MNDDLSKAKINVTFAVSGGDRKDLVFEWVLSDKEGREVISVRDALEKMRQRYGYSVWGSVIPIDTRFRDASKVGQPLPAMAPYARGSLAYKKLLNFLLGLQDQIQHAEESRKQSA